MLAPDVDAALPASAALSSDSGTVSGAVSGTDPPRNGQPSDDDVRGVEEQRQDDDPERAREHLVERVLAAQGADPAEDLIAEARPGGVGGDGRDAHQHLRRDPDAGEDR